MFKVFFVFTVILNYGVLADIDFDSLANKKVKKSEVKVGFSEARKAGDRQWEKKQEENRIEAEYYRRHRQNNVEINQGNTNTQSSRSGNSSNNYICTFKCKGSLGLQSSVSVSASSNHKAQVESTHMAHRWCQKMGIPDGVLSQWGTGSTDCTRK